MPCIYSFIIIGSKCFITVTDKHVVQPKWDIVPKSEWTEFKNAVTINLYKYRRMFDSDGLSRKTNPFCCSLNDSIKHFILYGHIIVLL